jgi:hypothetical protein
MSSSPGLPIRDRRYQPRYDFEALSMSTTGNPADGNSATWIDDGEKYGLVGLNVKVDGIVPQGKISSNLWVLADTAFTIPSN